MRVSNNNLLLFALFAGAIVLPTAILSILSFRNIQNEMFLAQKTFDENRDSFQTEIDNTIEKERNNILQETKAASLFLYGQPRSLLEFGNATTYKSVDGVEAIFLFNKGKLVYPDISSRLFVKASNYSNSTPGLVEKQLFREELNGPDPSSSILSRSLRLMQNPFQTIDDQVQNVLGLIRLSYKSKDYDEALRLLNILEQQPRLQGYLHADLTRSVNLLHFDILVDQKKHQEAEDYCLEILGQFLHRESIEDIPSAKFFFESAFTQILSFEDLSNEKREAFWNLRENFNRQISDMDILYRHKDLFDELIDNDNLSKEGLKYKAVGDIILLKIGYPILSGDQIVIIKVDQEAFAARILSKLSSTVKSWKNIPFSITNAQDSIILGSIPDSASVITQSSIGPNLQWELTFYEKDMREIRNESRQRMYLMYGLLTFSLITVLLGTIFMLRFIIQEHKLLAMKANFLSSVSHELKTPLTSIKMFAETMARGRIQRVEKIQEYSSLIGKEATRLENLIGAILNYTRMEHGKGAFKWEKLNLSDCVQKVFNSMNDIGVEKGMTFHTHFESEVFVIGDNTALYSLAQNLIENAIKYTNAPGEITIEVYNTGNAAIFSVADTGIGIASSEQKNIFNDFYRVGDEMTRSTKGSGLGLATVRKVVETHKATISLSSKLGKGSTFTVRFKKVE